MNWLLYRGEKFNPNFFYNAGVDIDHAFLLLSGERRALLVPEMNREYAESLFNGEVIAYGKKPIEPIKKILGKSGMLGLDLRSLPASTFLRLSKEFRKTKDISEELAQSRAKKGKREILLMKKAAAISKKIIEAEGKPRKKTEKEIAESLLIATYRAGAEPAFKPIVASGANSSFPHSVPSGKAISNPLLIDYGARISHYNSDLTRCSSLNAEQKKTYSKLKHISETIIDEMGRFQTGGELAKFARILYKKEGLAHPPHSVGHGIGLEVHEKPSLSISSKDKLEGATFAIEPSVYFTGKYGLRYENVVHFDGKKARVL